MRLATIDPHSRKVQTTKLYRIPKFGVNRPNSSKIQPFENLKRNVWPSGRCLDLCEPRCALFDYVDQ